MTVYHTWIVPTLNFAKNFFGLIPHVQDILRYNLQLIGNIALQVAANLILIKIDQYSSTIPSDQLLFSKSSIENRLNSLQV